MKSAILSGLIATMIAGPAHALSCMRADPALTFMQLQDDPDPYYVLHGTLTFDQSLMPQGVVNQQRTPAPIAATFQGRGLTNDGFNVMLNRAITIQPICLGPWCGALETDQDYLVFAKADQNDILLEVGPCGGAAFPNPTPETLNKIAACMNGATCAP